MFSSIVAPDYRVFFLPLSFGDHPTTHPLTHPNTRLKLRTTTMMRRVSSESPPSVPYWDQLCPKCQTVVKEHGYEAEVRNGPSYYAQEIQQEAEKKLKQMEDRLHQKEESEKALKEQMLFLSTWDPTVMTPALTDIILQSGGQNVNAHRAVLAAKSEVFLKKMKALDQLKNVTLEVHVMPEVLEPFVHYFYSGHISHRDLKNHASKVLTAAKRYAVPSLQLIAEQYIARHVTRDTALSVWELGVDHSSDTIKDAVLNILLHTKDLQDVLKLSEYHMFRAQKDPELLVGLFEQLVGRIT